MRTLLIYSITYISLSLSTDLVDGVLSMINTITNTTPTMNFITFVSFRRKRAGKVNGIFLRSKTVRGRMSVA